MKTYLRNDHGYQMNHWELYKALGLNPLRHLPSEGFEPRQIGNVSVWCLSKEDAFLFASARGKTFVKRLRCECPDCKKIIAPGHLHQHLSGCSSYLSNAEKWIEKNDSIAN